MHLCSYAAAAPARVASSRCAPPPPPQQPAAAAGPAVQVLDAHRGPVRARLGPVRARLGPGGARLSARVARVRALSMTLGGPVEGRVRRVAGGTDWQRGREGISSTTPASGTC